MTTRTILSEHFMIQVQQDDDSWSYYSQSEWDDQTKAAQFASSLYGGQVKTRLVKVTRQVI